jgi:hypothetical protein
MMIQSRFRRYAPAGLTLVSALLIPAVSYALDGKILNAETNQLGVMAHTAPVGAHTALAGR